MHYLGFVPYKNKLYCASEITAYTIRIGEIIVIIIVFLLLFFFNLIRIRKKWHCLIRLKRYIFILAKLRNIQFSLGDVTVSATVQRTDNDDIIL